MSTTTLVLNATYEPLGVVSERRAVVLVLAHRAVVLERGETAFHAERVTVPAPRVVRLSRYVRVPYRHGVPLTRRALFERDGYRCAYCAARAETVDHVIPRSRDGVHEWSNVVAACRRCNHQKSDRLLAELGWELRVAPRTPSRTATLLRGHAREDPLWTQYVAPWAEQVAG
ncbi:MAG: HNH endonuclease [Mycobacteriales bacterium]